MAYPTPGPPILLMAAPDAIRAIVAGDGVAIDEALGGLGAGDLMELAEAALLLADTARIASRGRGW